MDPKPQGGPHRMGARQGAPPPEEGGKERTTPKEGEGGDEQEWQPPPCQESWDGWDEWQGQESLQGPLPEEEYPCEEWDEEAPDEEGYQE